MTRYEWMKEGVRTNHSLSSLLLACGFLHVSFSHKRGVGGGGGGGGGGC